jgi:hypothetical protein
MRKVNKAEIYRSKSFTLPVSQIKWMRQLKAASLNDSTVQEEFELFESTVAREAFARLINVGGWPELKADLVRRARREPRPGRPKAG